MISCDRPAPANDKVAPGRLVQPYKKTMRNDQAYYSAHAPGVGQRRKIRLMKAWLLEEALTTDAPRTRP